MNVHAAAEGSPPNWPKIPHVRLGGLGAEPAMSELESEMQRSIHGFAEKVMRPVGIALDKLTPAALLGLSPEERGRLFPIIMEELGWGDAGLSIVIGACSLSLLMALPELVGEL